MHSEKKRSRLSGKKETGNSKAYSTKDNLFGFKCKIYYLTSRLNMFFLAIVLTAASVSDFCFNGFPVLRFIWPIKLNSSAGNVAPGFGIGALEEFDAEDEDVYASGQFFFSFRLAL